MNETAPNYRRPWDIALAVAFAIGSVFVLFPSVLYPGLIGSHAVLYTDAAAAIVSAGDPWTAGPPKVIFAGPPTMLLTFLPFVALPDLLIRVLWIALDIAVVVWAVRRLALPLYWLLFPPLVQTIVLGHPEVLLLGFFVGPRLLSGLAILVKPYAMFPLLAERRWKALAIGIAAVAFTAPFLPWPRFFDELPEIFLTIVRQNNGDSVFGDPLWTAVAVVALMSLGLRRALWLVVPVLWPYSQPNYKVMTVPALAPATAIFWAIPAPGFTLAGIVALAVLVTIDRVRPLPMWLRVATEEQAAREMFAEPRTLRLATATSDGGLA